MPQLNLTREDERLLHFFGVSAEPVLMTPSDWPRLCDQLRQDVAATEKDYVKLLKAYERLEEETRPVMWIVRLLRWATSPFGCGRCQ